VLVVIEVQQRLGYSNGLSTCIPVCLLQCSLTLTWQAAVAESHAAQIALRHPADLVRHLTWMPAWTDDSAVGPVWQQWVADLAAPPEIAGAGAVETGSAPAVLPEMTVAGSADLLTHAAGFVRTGAVAFGPAVYADDASEAAETDTPALRILA